MNRKPYSSVLAFALVCLAAGFLTSCSSSSSTPPPSTITVTLSSAPPSSMTTFQTVSVAATVANDSANAGVTWTCTASSGSCGTFSSPNSASGAAVMYTAASAAATFTITATSVSNTSVNATSSAVTVTMATTSNYVFYASGWEVSAYTASAGLPEYYAIAGVVQLDAGGNIYGGEQDYNDGIGTTANDQYTAAPGALVADPTTGVGTLTLTTSDTLVGVSGVETFAIQFVNSNHALVSQFDGTATSSGSFDLQNLSLGTAGPSAFALSGIDNTDASVGFGGIFSPNSTNTSASVTLDVNDFGAYSPGNTYTATIGTPDGFGRTVITGISNPVTVTPMTFAAYPVTLEAIRLIDIDAATTTANGDSAVGSAYGQGSAAGTFSDSSMPAAFTFNSIGQWTAQYATLGALTSDGVGDLVGQGDDNELDNGINEFPDTIVSGSGYSIGSNGYGSMGLVWGVGNEDATFFGVYMVDPTLNINDPNNTGTTGTTNNDVGGALIVDLDSALPGGMGVITPQTDTTQADFTGNYAAGFQNYNDFACTASPCPAVGEIDMVGPFSMTATTGPLSTASIGANDSDPFGTWDGTPAESTGDTFTVTPFWVSAGFYSMSQGNSTPNPIEATINLNGPFPLDVDIYQASATTLYWIESIDINGVYLGSLQAQGTLSSMPAVKRPGTAPKLNKNAKSTKALGGQVRR